MVWKTNADPLRCGVDPGYAAIQEGSEFGSADAHAPADIAKTTHKIHAIARGMRAMIAPACEETGDLSGSKFDP